jgi:two-component system, LytTR family, sensor kinase
MIKLLNINKIHLKTIGIHCLTWLVLFWLNFLLAKNFRFDFDVAYFIWVWVIYMLLFYINYILLMPFFFFKRRFFLYAIFTITLLVDAYYVKNLLEFNHSKEMFSDINKDSFLPPKPGMFLITSKGDTIFPPEPRPNEMFIPNGPPPGNMQKPIFFRRGMPWGVNFISLYGLFLIYTASISVRFVQRWQDDEKRKSEIEKEKIATELNFLKQQINPHFLFNSLNSIYSLSISKSDKVTNSILKLSSILRYMLYESDNKPVSLREELSIITDYIELQKLRLTEKVSLNYEVIGDSEQFRIEPFILIPLIENAFKYGVDSVNDTFIDIKIKIFHNKLELLIKNKIVEKNLDKNESGIGLKNIKRRLDLLYTGKFKFSAVANDDIFSVHLEVTHKV